MARPALRLTLLLLSVASLVVAGCVGSAQAASAKQNLAPADEAAKAWDPGARLAQVVGVEGTFALLAATVAQANARDFAPAGDDETVGDGLAEVWVYRYVAAGKEKSYVVVLDKEGTILRKGEEARREGDRPLASWSLDSHEAMEVALKTNEDLRAGIAGQYFGIVSVLHQEEGLNPVWLVAGGGGDLTGGKGGHVAIDAVTGTVLFSEGGLGGR